MSGKTGQLRHGLAIVPPRTETPPSPCDLEPLLTAEQVAGILAVRVKRVYELGIPSVRLSVRTLRWRRADVMTWLAARSGSNEPIQAA